MKEEKEIQASWLMIGLGSILAFIIFWGGFKLSSFLFFDVFWEILPNTSWTQFLIALVYTSFLMIWAVICVMFAKYLAVQGTKNRREAQKKHS